jgi:hypothetical protein
MDRPTAVPVSSDVPKVPLACRLVLRLFRRQRCLLPIVNPLRPFSIAVALPARAERPILIT